MAEIKLRINQELKDDLKKIAKDEGRSLNKQIEVFLDFAASCYTHSKREEQFVNLNNLEMGMNLIEQLGGYERAKEWYKDQDLRGNHTTRIRAALLEYRRQHNIFEVGDKVVLISMSDNEVFEYTEYSKGLDLHFFESEHNYGHAKLSNIRHATDEEIKAGRRL